MPTETDSFEEIKENIRNTRFHSDLLNTKERWIPLKKALDEISKQILPFKDLYGILSKRISVDMSKFTSQQRYFLTSLMKNANEQGVILYETSPTATVLSSKGPSDLINGDSLIIKDPEKFNTYKGNIDEICSIIEQIEVEKFSKITDLKLIKKCKALQTIEEKDKGFLTIDGEKIPIGKSNSGKFKLLAKLLNPVGIPIKVDIVFEYITAENKQPQKTRAYTHKLKNIKNQLKEANRSIRENKIKVNSVQFKLYDDLSNETIWLLPMVH